MPNLHGHPPSRHNSIPESPIHTTTTSPLLPQSQSGYRQTTNGKMDRRESSDIQTPVCPPPKPLEEKKPVRADPMSFSSILSSNAVDPPKSTGKSVAPQKQLRRSSKTPNGDASTTAVAVALPNGSIRRAARKTPPSIKEEPAVMEHVREITKSKATKAISGSTRSAHATSSDKENSLEVQKALDEINMAEHSDVEAPGWDDAMELHRQVSQKRQLMVEESEAIKHKVRTLYLAIYHTQCVSQSQLFIPSSVLINPVVVHFSNFLLLSSTNYVPQYLIFTLTLIYSVGGL